MPNPTTNPTPDDVTCVTCFGWGTVIKRSKVTPLLDSIHGKGLGTKTWAGPCEVCSGTGRRPVPKSETEQ